MIKNSLVRIEVLKNALESIADGMALTVVRTSRSQNVRASMDFSTGILTGNGELIAQGQCIPVHLGGMPVALEACVSRYADTMSPGDVFVTNDPYEGGSHLPDIFLFKPVFVDDMVVAYFCAMTHHADVGGRVAAGNACDSTEIYQEGLRIPPLRLFNQGLLNDTLWRLIEKAVRVPEIVLADILSNIAAIDFGEQEFRKVIKKYGVEETKQVMEDLLDYTETLARQAISMLPDGSWTFTDYIDNDGFTEDRIAIVTNLIKREDRLHFDFTGTSDQVKGSIQPVFATTKAMVYAVVRTVLGSLGYDIPNTQGYFRPITVTAAEGSFVNPRIPAAVAARGLSCERIAQTVFGVFSEMLPDKIPACAGGAEVGASMSGYQRSDDGWKAWILMDFQMETARGGGPGKEGLDAHYSGIISIGNIPAEQIEIEYPVKLIQYGFAPNTEGAGEYRGGMGIVREWQYLAEETAVVVRSDRQNNPPYGLQGGLASAPTQVILRRVSQDDERMPSKFSFTAYEGDRLCIKHSGAGGWGDPIIRSPDRVLEDVVDEKVSVERAENVYGVIVDIRNTLVDENMTIQKRNAMATGSSSE